ncbi:MAG: hypothetical protein IT374_12020 [Polyangiaceae bacterium]|nr:hypothetical protein [Polyangiaceae bacterium]
MLFAPLLALSVAALACGGDSDGDGAGAAGSPGASNQAGAGGFGKPTCNSSSSEGDGCAAEVAGCALDGTWDIATTTPCQPPIASASPPTQVTFATAGGTTCATTAASGVKLEIGAGCAAKLTWSDRSASSMGSQCFSCSTYRELTLTVASDGTATGTWDWRQLGECGGTCASSLTLTKK